MLDELGLTALRFDCAFCGESIEADGYDVCDVMQTTHYCALDQPLEARPT